MTPVETVSALRYRCERIARDLGVPFEAVVQFIADDLGGVEKYCADGDYAGPLEIQEKVLSFCRRYALDRLPPAQRDAVGYMAQRRNTFGRRAFMDAAEPIMRRHHIQPSGWDAVIQAALHIPGLLWLHQYTGSLDQAIDDLSRYLTERTSDMVDQQLKTRTEQINECLNGHFSVLDIADKTKQRTHTRNALKGTIPDVASGNDKIEDIVAQIDAYFAKVKEGKDELAAHGLGKRPEPSADAQTPLFGMNAKAAADARPKVDFKGDPIQPRPEAPAAPPAVETPSAGDAIPEIGASPISAPVAHESTAKTEPPAEGEGAKEVAQLYVKLDFVLDDTLQYNLEARWSKETGDVWVAKAITKGSRADERTKPMVEHDVEVYLKAKKAVEVLLEIEYEPTAAEIDDLRKPALAMIRDMFDKDTDQQVAEHFKAGTGCDKAADALRFQPKQAVLDRLHVYLVKAHEERQAEEARHEANTRAITTTTRTEIDVADAAPSNIIPFPGSPLKLPSEYEFKMMEIVARNAAKSQLYKDVTSYEKAFMILWRGWELGVNFGTSLEGIWVIEGRPWVGAQVLAAVVVERARPFRFSTVVNEAGTEAVCTVQRKEGDPIQQFKFTKDDAVKAGLWENEKKAWKKFPKPMLKRRATRDAILSVFPDIAAGLGLADEDQKDEAA